jgi:putative transposase
MRATIVESFVHLIWGTHRRRPMIEPEIETRLLRNITAKASSLGCLPHAIGGTDDHVHLLARLHPAIAIARLVAEAKGASAHFANHELGARNFRWQLGYGCFTVSTNELAAVDSYVRSQRLRHRSRSTQQNLELPDWTGPTPGGSLTGRNDPG